MTITSHGTRTGKYLSFARSTQATNTISGSGHLQKHEAHTSMRNYSANAHSIHQERLWKTFNFVNIQMMPPPVDGNRMSAVCVKLLMKLGTLLMQGYFTWCLAIGHCSNRKTIPSSVIVDFSLNRYEDALCGRNIDSIFQSSWLPRCVYKLWWRPIVLRSSALVPSYTDYVIILYIVSSSRMFASELKIRFHFNDLIYNSIFFSQYAIDTAPSDRDSGGKMFPMKTAVQFILPSERDVTILGLRDVFPPTVSVNFVQQLILIFGGCCSVSLFVENSSRTAHALYSPRFAARFSLVHCSVVSSSHLICDAMLLKNVYMRFTHTAIFAMHAVIHSEKSYFHIDNFCINGISDAEV